MLLLALTFAVGTAAHGVQMPGVSGVGTKMSAVAGTPAPMSGRCDGCADDQKGAAPAACIAFCGSFVAVPVTAVAFHAVPTKIVQYASPERANGRTEPPEPHPPRPAILS